VNNSLARLIEGMVETLRLDIIPKLDGEFVRGQAYGVIYMLNSMKLRTSWSATFLCEQLNALTGLVGDLAAISGLPETAPRPDIPAPLPLDAKALEVLRDAGDEAVSALIVWLGEHGATLPDAALAAANQAIKAYIHRQLKHELQTSARPMFAEISLGKETT
jgi:hypothetical protein